MIGVVLCGGQSTRMGQDKGLLELGNERWAEVIQKKMISLGVPTVLSINPQQLSSYSNYFDHHSLIVDNADLKFQGPLLGVMTTHLTFPEEDLFVMACDLINIDAIIIRYLMDAYGKLQPNAVAFRSNTNVEPLCAIYSSPGLKKINSFSSQNALQRNSMKYILDVLQTTYLPIKEGWQLYFKNFNQKEDIS